VAAPAFLAEGAFAGGCAGELRDEFADVGVEQRLRQRGRGKEAEAALWKWTVFGLQIALALVLAGALGDSVRWRRQ
jgi:hypothetical protein